jgi:ATP-dependent RNA helicase HrpA
VLAHELHRMTGVPIPPGSWDLTKIPDHLRVTFVVEGDDGKTLAEGKDLAALKDRLTPKVRETLTVASGSVERRGLTSWTIGTLPAKMEKRQGAFTVTAFPALFDDGDTVSVRAFESHVEQQRAMLAGTRRLLLLSMPSAAKFVSARLTNQSKLALSHNPHRSAVDLLDDCGGAAVDALVAAAGGPAWDEAGFVRLRDHVRGYLVDTVFDVVRKVEPILAAWYAIGKRIGSTSNPFLAPSLVDIKAQLGALVYRGFVTDSGYARLPDLLRYLRAIEKRLDRLTENPPRDRELMRQVAAVDKEYRQVRAEYPVGRSSAALDDVRWMIEELRVSYFAQALGTAYPISDVRIYRALDALG